MPEKTPNIANAKYLCTFCEFAGVSGIDIKTDRCDISCYAQVIPHMQKVIGDVPRFDPATEKRVPSTHVKAKLVYVYQPGASCIMMEDSKLPDDLTCPRALAAKNSEAFLPNDHVVMVEKERLDCVREDFCFLK